MTILKSKVMHFTESVRGWLLVMTWCSVLLCREKAEMGQIQRRAAGRHRAVSAAGGAADSGLPAGAAAGGEAGWRVVGGL